MKKCFPLLLLFSLFLFSNCKNETAPKPAEIQKAAAEEKEAVALDSMSNELTKEKADIEESVQKLEESLKAIEK